MAHWFRLYDEVVEDPKVQRLSPELFKTWVNLLCLASKNKGILPCSADVAFTLRISEKEASNRLDRLLDAGLLDEEFEGLKPHGWDKRQFVSDISTDRVRRFRERSRNVSEALHETPPYTDTDTDTDTEQKKDNKRSKQVRTSDPEGFLDFYSRYPRKTGRGKAVLAWRKAVKKASIEEIMKGLDGHKFSEDKQFIPEASAWLNAERWTDETQPTGEPKTKTYWDMTAEERAEYDAEHQRKLDLM